MSIHKLLTKEHKIQSLDYEHKQNTFLTNERTLKIEKINKLVTKGVAPLITFYSQHSIL